MYERKIKKKLKKKRSSRKQNSKSHQKHFNGSKIGVANGKIKTARVAFFSARPRLSYFLNCETKTFEISEHCEKKSRLRDLKSAEKTRLRDPWNSTKILRDPDFLKDHSLPLKINSQFAAWDLQMIPFMFVFCLTYSMETMTKISISLDFSPMNTFFHKR